MPLLRERRRVGLFARVAAGERDDAHDVRVLDALLVEVVGLGEGQLQHHELVGAERVELLEQRGLQEAFGLGLRGAVDVDLGLDDRHETVTDDLLADLELLIERRP